MSLEHERAPRPGDGRGAEGSHGTASTHTVTPPAFPSERESLAVLAGAACSIASSLESMQHELRMLRYWVEQAGRRS